MKNTDTPTEKENKMADKPDISYMQHQWAFVVIPVHSTQIPLFVAYCRMCKSYYTRALSYNTEAEGYLGPTNLPEWGCVQPVGV